MSRPVFVEYAREMSILFIVVGIALIVESVLELTGTEILGLGGWEYYVVAIGFLLLLTGVLMFYGYAKRVRHFNELLKVKSKKEFVGIQDDMEYTAWRLPSKFDKKVEEKKKEFGVK